MKRRAKFHGTQQDLLAALTALRHLVKEVGGNYLAGLQSNLAAVELAVRQAEDAATRTQLQSMLKSIQAIDIKPQKGRRKDLKAIDGLIDKLNDTVGDW